MTTTRRKSKGVALLSVLLIVALATTLAFQMASRHALTIANGRLLLDGSQARHYALGGEQYARQLLYADWEDIKTRALDTLQEDWSVPEQLFEIEGGALDLRIDDLTARFNINTLAGNDSAQNLARLKGLFTHLGLDAGAADAWRDWIDADQEIQDMGAEDSEYLLREPPFRAANQPAADITELVLAMPFAAAEFALLRPHVVVLPAEQLSVNVNTASAAVLLALAPNLSPARVQSLVEAPRSFDDIEMFIAEYAEFGASTEVLNVASEFFRVQVRATVGDVRSELTAVIHRDEDSGALTTLSRTFGKRFEERGEVDDVGSEARAPS